tara:strand:- start:75 stop:200 length:126 start_codon:yes stop_codon:yes gene_type:complete
VVVEGEVELSLVQVEEMVDLVEVVANLPQEQLTLVVEVEHL